jgi:hypothetical protein
MPDARKSSSPHLWKATGGRSIWVQDGARYEHRVAAASDPNFNFAFQPDQIKLDMKLICGIEQHGPRQAIFRAINQICLDLGIDVIAEGVETELEYAWLASQGIHPYQGYLFAKPGFELFPNVYYPEN